MSAPLPRPATSDALFVWVMHRFAAVFEEHAVLKGGMALRLVDSPRSTTDIDYVFVPFTSKNDIREDVERVLRELEGAEVAVRLHSTMLRADVRVDDVAVQVEVSVATDCSSTAMATAGFAQSVGQPSHVVRVMRWDTALAHKLAAWNERRLLRDLYDCYFLSARLGQLPDFETLDLRLEKVRSRLPGLKARSKMTRDELAATLRAAAARIDAGAIAAELAPLLPETELAGLETRLRAAVVRLAERLEDV
ncbi:MAG: hypothetical protein DRQ55_05980 [Planctomycetota bacterium]|nr:MAG: hypothetical protein DRQ55_05980 [Planctomycetota bacterium]